MSRGLINEATMDAMQPGELLWDINQPGFGCRRLLRGHINYIIKYQRGRRQRWYIIASHHEMTPETARGEARRLLREIANGADPSREKREAMRAGTVAELGERFLERHSKVHKKASSSAEDERIFERYIRPRLGGLRAQWVKRADIADFMVDMKETPYMANRALALISCMFGKGEELRIDVPLKNPCEGVRRYREKSRERYLSPAEIKRLARALRVVDAAGVAVYFVALVRLLLLTGARVSEILTAKWEYLGSDGRELRLPDSKTGPKTIYLSVEAAIVINGLKKQPNNPYLICGARYGKHLVNAKAPWRRLKKAAAIHDVRLSDLRNTYASIAATQGLSLILIGKLLGNRSADATLRFAHVRDDAASAASDSVKVNLGGFV